MALCCGLFDCCCCNDNDEDDVLAYQQRNCFLRHGAPGDWSSALCSLYECTGTSASCFCPCLVMHEIADVLADNHRSYHQSTLCGAMVVSCILDAPILLCTQQFGARAAERAFRGASQEDGNPNHHNENDSFLPRFLNPEPPKTTTTWANDGVGWDLASDASEDWWPAHWCAYHTMVVASYLQHHMCDLCCCCSSSSSSSSSSLRLPLCFSLMGALLYPMLLCPITYHLRRMVIERSEIRTENNLKTMAVSLCCMPCALWQTRQEVVASSSGLMMPPRRQQQSLVAMTDRVLHPRHAVVDEPVVVHFDAPPPQIPAMPPPPPPPRRARTPPRRASRSPRPRVARRASPSPPRRSSARLATKKTSASYFSSDTGDALASPWMEEVPLTTPTERSSCLMQ